MKSNKSLNKLKLFPLVALVIGSMIGGGIFSLPQNISVSASIGAAIIGWFITALGMLSLICVFKIINIYNPNTIGGIYDHAKLGFGDFIGFESALGYWISAWIGNVSYFLLLFSTLGYFFPIFGDGNTLISIMSASILLWSSHILILKGVKEAIFVNMIVTICKILPLFIFILICSFSFKYEIFVMDFWGLKNIKLGGISNQISNMMFVTVWAFIGIESAGIFSSRSKNRSDLIKSTIIGFFFVLFLLISINIVSCGIMSQSEIAKLQNPSMAGVLEHAIGHWGAIFVSIGLIISLLGSLLSWLLLCSEILYIASYDKIMPKFLSKKNLNGAPINALYITNIMIQLSLIISFISKSTYFSMLCLSTSMILVPYFCSSIYSLKLIINNTSYKNINLKYICYFIITSISIIYITWLIWISGIKYLLFSALFYIPGTILFVKARHEMKKPIFSFYEKIFFITFLIFSSLVLFTFYKKSFIF